MCLLYYVLRASYLSWGPNLIRSIQAVKRWRGRIRTNSRSSVRVLPLYNIHTLVPYIRIINIMTRRQSVFQSFPGTTTPPLSFSLLLHIHIHIHDLSQRANLPNLNINNTATIKKGKVNPKTRNSRLVNTLSVANKHKKEGSLRYNLHASETHRKFRVSLNLIGGLQAKSTQPPRGKKKKSNTCVVFRKLSIAKCRKREIPYIFCSFM
jgi:hypothetical protein